jgi:hypothetical protein
MHVQAQVLVATVKACNGEDWIPETKLRPTVGVWSCICALHAHAMFTRAADASYDQSLSAKVPGWPLLVFFL